MPLSSESESTARYLVVSLGSIGRRHLANLRRLRPDAQIAVCRLSGAAVAGELPEHSDVVFDNLADAVAFSPTAAIVAGPASTHVAVATTLARAGVHLLIEKPLSTNTASAIMLHDVVDRAGVIVSVGYNLRLLPGFQTIKREMEQASLGRVLSVRAAVGQYLPDWRPTQDYRQSVSAQAKLGGGVLLELSHEIDYLVWLFGVPDRVSAVGGRVSALEIDVEDLVELVMHYDSPAKLVAIHLDFLDRACFRELRVIGETGTLHFDAIGGQLRMYQTALGQWSEMDTVPASHRNDMYVEELRQFLECVESEQAPAVPLGQAVDVMRVIDAARESMSIGHAVEVVRNV